MMQMNERAEAIRRAQRALKALGEHPRSSKKELGHAREHLNACYSAGDGDRDRVWDSVSPASSRSTSGPAASTSWTPCRSTRPASC